MKLAFLFVFFVSGFAALVYQTVWQRLLIFFGGADVYSVTIIVSAFMGGLGFGSLVGGHLADRLRGRTRLIAFAGCEVAVGIFALLSATIYYDVLYIRLGTWEVPRSVLGVVIFLVTLWPTFFMGMSLPLAARVLTDDARQPARWIPLLYGWNTLGAACGSFAAVAVLFRSFDFPSSLRVGAILSFGCALIALSVVPFLRQTISGLTERNEGGGASSHEDLESAVTAPSQFGIRSWILIYALSGFVALSLEIVWFRILGVILKSNSFTFGHLLAIYLGGVGSGALLARLRFVRRWQPAPAFLLLQAAIPVYAAFALIVLVAAVGRVAWGEPVWNYMAAYEALGRNDIAGSQLLLALYGIVPLWLIGPPTLMMGLSFGLIQRAVQTDLHVLGRRLGWLQTANIVGGMVGATLTGLVLLHWVGSAGTLRLLVCCGGVFLWMYARAERQRFGSSAPTAAVIVLVSVAVLIPSAGRFWARLHAAPEAEVIYAEDSSGLSLLKKGAGARTIVYANGLGQSTLPYGGDLHTVLGALPALIHPNPRAVAVIGLGSGDTVFAIGGRRETQTIDSIEIIAPELQTLRMLDQSGVYAGLRMLLRDGRVQHWFTDGRAFLAKRGERYDIIEADALRPTSAYSGNLYSLEYFALLREHLNPGGLAVTWMPTPRVRDTIIAAFPHVLTFRDIAIGGTGPIAFDDTVVRARIQEPFTRAYYAGGGVELERLIAPFLADRPIAYGSDFDRSTLTDLNRDLFPKDEFALPQKAPFLRESAPN